MAQFGRPTTEPGVGGWLTQSGGAGIASVVDETTPSDTDYGVASDSASDVLRLSGFGLAEPTVAGDRIIRYRLGTDTGVDGSVDAVVSLKQGATVIAAWNHPKLSVTPQDFAQTLTAPQIALITDYPSLELDVESRTFRPNNYPLIKVAAGYYAVPDMFMPCTTNSNSIAADTIYWVPLFLPWEQPFTVLGGTVQVALGPTATLRIGLYDTDMDGMPTVLLRETAALSASSTGNKSGTVSAFTLPVGWYWLGIWSDGGAGSIWTINTGITLWGWDTSGGFQIPGCPITTSLTYGAFPSNAPAFNGFWSTLAFPRLGVG